MVARRQLSRPLGERRYKKLFVIATEGTKTEPQYFSLFDHGSSVLKVVCLKGKRGSSPPQVLRRMTDHLKNEGLRFTDEAWLVVDKDDWTDLQLLQLHKWSLSQDNYGLALSNPNFEFWILLHFDDEAGALTGRECLDRLQRWIRNYDKKIDTSKISQAHVEAAIARAKKRDQPPSEDWPRNLGQTTVYRLVQNILAASK